MILPSIEKIAPFGDAIEVRNQEWLVTNGLGGYASGSLAGVATRKYHGMLMANLPDPKGRHLLISRLDERFSSGGGQIYIGGADGEGEFCTDPVAPLVSFQLRANTAVWVYDIGGSRIEKSVTMPHLQNTVCIRYRLISGPGVAVALRPFLPFRRQDEDPSPTGDRHFLTTIAGDRIAVSTPNESLMLRLTVRPGPFVYVADVLRAEQQFLWREKLRGNSCEETTDSPGYLSFELVPGVAMTLIASGESWERLEFEAEEVTTAQARRITALLEHMPLPHDRFASLLCAAADQFLIRPGSRIGEAALAEAEGHALRTVIAGYHWFGDWGRDTMIALEGLMLCTGRHREARATLLTFAHYVQDGLLPNLFPEGEGTGLYHTVDASLWYFHAINRYLRATGDREVLGLLLPVLRDIVARHLEGTRFGIRVDRGDGLVTAGDPAHALTWMDAHAGDWIVTPRRGKPVEIQALWYNALKLMEHWHSRDPGRAATYSGMAATARASFNDRFPNAGTGCLFDVIDGPDGDDASLRPNQLLAVSLDQPILEEARWGAVVGSVEDHLLTPFGLRTLSRSHPDYRIAYGGTLLARDAAYHQGTVWPWLIGHFVDASLKVHGDKARCRRLLEAFPMHLETAGIGSISEVFDADLPHAPHGCIAQAWSVAEILRSWQATAPAAA